MNTCKVSAKSVDASSSLSHWGLDFSQSYTAPTTRTGTLAERWDALKEASMGKDDALELKHRVIDKAREQVTAGAHYLWSAAGATTGQKDGASYRKDNVLLQPNIPDLTQASNQVLPKGPPFAPALFSAWADTSDQEQVACTGRAGLAPVQQLPLALDLDVHIALRLPLKKLTAEQIDEFKNNANHVDQFRWPRPITPRNRIPGDVSTIWGESCIGVRHFDCIGLVNFCFSWALNRTWQYGVDNFALPEYAKKAGFTQVDLTKASPGDIVTIDREHIGIVTFEGTAIESRDALTGVVENALDNKYWKQCYRLPAGEWKSGP
jgi:hypothetical protein